MIKNVFKTFTKMGCWIFLRKNTILNKRSKIFAKFANFLETFERISLKNFCENERKFSFLFTFLLPERNFREIGWTKIWKPYSTIFDYLKMEKKMLDFLWRTVRSSRNPNAEEVGRVEKISSCWTRIRQFENTKMEISEIL